MREQIDYEQSDVWERIAALLEGVTVPRLPRNCGRVHCEPGWYWQPRLRDYDLWFAVQGRGAMEIAGQRYPIQPGDLFMLRPGDHGWATQEPDDRLTVVYLHLDLMLPTPFDEGWLPSRRIPFSEPTAFDQLLTRAVRLVEREDALAAVEARFVVQQCLALIYRQDAINHGLMAAQRDRRIEQVIAHLRSRPEQRLSLEQAAALVGLAPTYMSRLFTQETGMSFRAFALRTRLQRAQTLLEESDMPIGAIAQVLGYDDIFLFSRQFKQQYGMSPRQMRQRRD